MKTAALKGVVRLYYGYQFFFALLLWLPIFYEYQKHFGLNDSQIFGIQSIYYTVFCFLEIPTGMAADRWGHRRCLRWSAVTLVVANLLPVLTPNYDGFLWHFLLIALARSFNSGASSAYLYDYLNQHGEVGVYKQVEGNARAYGLVGKVVCWAFIGSAMKWHIGLPYWLTVVAAVISGIYAWRLPALILETSTLRPAPLGERLVTVARILRATPFLVLLMLQGIAIFTLGRICQVNLFQPILSAKQFDLTWFGIVMSAMTVFEAIGSGRPGWIRRWLDDLNAVFLLTAVMAGCLALLPFSSHWTTVAWLCVFSYAAGLSFPIQRQLLNDAIVDSRFRATLLSVESILDRAVCAWVAGLIGGYLQAGRLDGFLITSAMATIVGMALLFLVMRLSRSRTVAAG